MKRSELLFNVSAVPLDFAMLILAGIISFYWRLEAQFAGPVQYELSLQNFLTTAVSILPAVILIFALLGLYKTLGTVSIWRQIGKIVIGVSVALFLVMVLFFFDRTVFPSRFIILSSWALGILFVSLGRALLRIVQIEFLSRGWGRHRVIVVNGNHQHAEVILQNLKNPQSGYEVAALIDFQNNMNEVLETAYLKYLPDEIIHANPTLTDEENLLLLEFARSKGMAFSYVPNLFEVQRNVIEVAELAGVPVIGIKNSPLDGWGRVIKRVVDIILSALGLLVASPLFFAVWLAIKLDSPGPTIYGAMRGGKSHDFMFYKFRSMYTHLSPGLGGEEAEKVRQQLWQVNDRGGSDAPFLKVKNDPRVTKVGRFIRRTKLDELPQFWNVLRGDMSLVGPRAHVLDEVERYRNRYRRMFSIKPGIFGSSQIAQMSWPDLPFEEEIRLNTAYIENWSLWLDIQILLKTAWKLLFGRKPLIND